MAKKKPAKETEKPVATETATVQKASQAESSSQSLAADSPPLELSQENKQSEPNGSEQTSQGSASKTPEPTRQTTNEHVMPRPADHRDRMVTLFVREQIQMSPDSPFVFHPRFMNRERSRIKAIVRLPDGRFTEMEVDRSDLRSPLLRDIYAQYTEDEIELFTLRQLRVGEVRRQLDIRMAEDKQIAEQRDATYQAKSEAFKIEAVNSEKNKEVRRRIRQARTVMEVHALTTIALMNTLGEASSSSDESDQDGDAKEENSQ